MFFKREVMFFELPGAGGNNIFWAPRTVYFNLYAFCGASDINNFWQCLHILYECVFDSFTGTDLALAPTSIPSPSLSLIIFISIVFYLRLSLISESLFLFPFCKKVSFNTLHFVFYCHVVNYLRIYLLDIYWFRYVNYFCKYDLILCLTIF